MRHAAATILGLAVAAILVLGWDTGRVLAFCDGDCSPGPDCLECSPPIPQLDNTCICKKLNPLVKLRLRCLLDEMKAMTKLVGSELKAVRNDYNKPNAVKLDERLAKAEDKFDAMIQKAINKAEGNCAGVQTADQMKSLISGVVAHVAGAALGSSPSGAFLDSSSNVLD